MVNVLLINKSAKPITITSFSSKNLKSMDTYTINDNYNLEVNNYDIHFLKDYNFTLPVIIRPYEAIQKRIILLATDQEMMNWKHASKKIKITIHTSRRDALGKDTKSFKVTVTNIGKISNNPDKGINEEPKLKHIDLGTYVINPSIRRIIDSNHYKNKK